MELTRELAVLVQPEPPSGPRVDVTLQMRAKHADLLRAARKLGGIQQLADHLGVSYGTMSHWICLHAAPRYWIERSKWSEPEFRDPLAEKLLALTGKQLAELWPAVLFTKEFMDQDKTTELETHATLEGILFNGCGPAALPDPHEIAEQHEQQALIQQVMQSLTGRERLVIEARYGFGQYAGIPQTYRALAVTLNVTLERVRQIEKHAVERLRHRSRIRLLQDYSGEDEEDE